MKPASRTPQGLVEARTVSSGPQRQAFQTRSMTSASTVSFGRSTQGLFNPDEVRELMHVEFDRALRHDYPIACLLMQVDRLFELETTYGFEVRQEILQALTRLLQQETRAGDFLGMLVDDRLLILLPHTSGEVGMLLARRILESARQLEFEIGGRSLRVTLSIGLSHNRHKDARSFATLVRVAEEGASVADSAGGNRCVETELYTLFERGVGGRSDVLDAATPPSRLPEPEPEAEPEPEPEDEQEGGEVARQEAATVAADSPSPAEVAQAGWDRWIRGPKDDQLRRRLEALVDIEGSLEAAVARMAEEVMGGARQQVEAQAVSRPQRAGDLSEDREGEYLREIDVLQRRITKLSQSLGLTEEVLRRVKQGEKLDTGLASIYRDVQGLDDDEPDADLKRELMSSIFEANMGLQKKGTG